MSDIALGPAGIIHIVWEEGDQIYHSYRASVSWSQPIAVATGERPAVAVSRDGTAHLTFTNGFGGRLNVYHCQWNGTVWSLPRNVSNTTGGSSNPDIAVTSAGIPHVVWVDYTPGQPVIYHGVWNGWDWTTFPVLSGEGTVPSIAIKNDDVPCVIWQVEEPDGFRDIYYVERDGASWSWAQNISDTPGVHSTSCKFVVGHSDLIRFAWQEQTASSSQIYYCSGSLWQWGIPKRVSREDQNAWLPDIAVDSQDGCHVIWDETVRVTYRRLEQAASAWSEAKTIVESTWAVSDALLVAEDMHRVHATWSQQVASGGQDVFYSARTIDLPLKIYLPLMRDTD